MKQEALKQRLGMAQPNRGSVGFQEALAQPEQIMQDSTCSTTLRLQGKPYPRTCKKCGLGPCIAQPSAQPEQEPWLLETTQTLAKTLAREWEKVDMREHAKGNLGIGTAPPPQRTWVGLKPEQVQFYAALHRQLEVVYYDATLDTNVITETFNATDFYQQVESELKELNK